MMSTRVTGEFPVSCIMLTMLIAGNDLTQWKMRGLTGRSHSSSQQLRTWKPGDKQRKR